MKIPLLAPFVFSAALTALSLQANTVLVDTDFTEASGEGEIETRGRGQVPLTQPTSASASAPSTATTSRQASGELKTPHALIKIQGRDDNPEAAANATIQWDLRGLPELASGQFEITYTATILEPTESGGMFRVNFENDSGSAGSIHPSARPLTILFRGDQVRSNTKGTASVSVVYGTPFTVKITFDLGTNTWSAFVDGSPIVDNSPFSEAFLQAYPNRKILNLEFGSLGGEGHSPRGAFALSNVRMEHVKD